MTFVDRACAWAERVGLPTRLAVEVALSVVAGLGIGFVICLVIVFLRGY